MKDRGVVTGEGQNPGYDGRHQPICGRGFPMRRLLSRIFGDEANTLHRSRRTNKARDRLVLEALEDRCVPATLGVHNGILTYNASAGIANGLTIAVSGTGAGCGRAKLAGDREDAKSVAASLIHVSVGEVWSVSVDVASMFIVPYAEVSTISYWRTSPGGSVPPHVGQCDGGSSPSSRSQRLPSHRHCCPVAAEHAWIDRSRSVKRCLIARTPIAFSSVMLAREKCRPLGQWRVPLWNAPQKNVLVNADDALNMGASVSGGAIESRSFAARVVAVNQAACRQVRQGQIARRGSVARIRHEDAPYLIRPNIDCDTEDA
jgi:hypothetical protein